MKTEQLLEALVADQASRRQPIARSLFRALALGAILSLVFFAVELGVRADIGPALETWRFDLKIVTVLLALILGIGLCLDCLRPDAPPHPLRRLLPLLAVVLTAIAVELAMVPLSGWKARLIGTNSLICLSMVPVLSLAPLAAILAVLRRGAPASPTLAGAAAGFLAAACGATLYAFHCFDDSPLFVATWYLLATIPVVVIGAVAGSRLLRW
jgi:hypothetical protein